MARSPTVSDEEILDAAKTVLYRRGPDAFTLAEVATAVGLSRAAIILRFKSTQELKITLLGKMVSSFTLEVENLPKTPGGDNLLKIAAFIGNRLSDVQSLSSFLNNHLSNISEPALADLEKKRGAAWFNAISRAMPPVAIDHDAAVAAFSAHLSGTLLAWPGRDNETCLNYMLRRTREWLRLAGIPYSERSEHDEDPTNEKNVVEDAVAIDQEGKQGQFPASKTINHRRQLCGK